MCICNIGFIQKNPLKTIIAEPLGENIFNWVEDSSFLEQFMIIIADNSGNIHDSIMIGES
jgi:hypothetical protein